MDRGGNPPFPLSSLTSERAGVPVPMSYSVVVPAPVPLPPLLFLGLFLYVCNLAIVNAADADAAPRPAPAAVSALVDWSSILTLRFKVSTTVKEKDKYQWLAFITVLLARQQSGLSFLRT